MTVIETDYLVVGAGAGGMAFADEVINHGEVDVVLVDRRHSPGGHWNDAYPFVRLHQPSAAYGVGSRPLGSDAIDTTGPNAGYYERATGGEICEYYRGVLDERLVPSGRVRFFGGHDYVGDWSGEHAIVSRLSGRSTEIRVRRKVVDTTYLETSIPATHTPSFTAEPEARVVPAGALADIVDPPAGYTVLGAGKTAMDACCWLLENGVDPDRIRWVRPRDAWVLDRSLFQQLDLVASLIDGMSRGIEAIAHASTAAELFERVEGDGVLHRLDPTVEPTMFRAAILSSSERTSLQQIECVVRQGPVLHIGADRVVLKDGEISTDRGVVHVDCTAYGLGAGRDRPVFEPGRITVQSAGQTGPAAALIAFLDATRDDDHEKNRLAPPTVSPTRAIDFVTMLADVVNTMGVQAAEPDVNEWRDRSRLNITRGLTDHLDDPVVQSAMARWMDNLEPALANVGPLTANYSARV